MSQKAQFFLFFYLLLLIGCNSSQKINKQAEFVKSTDTLSLEKKDALSLFDVSKEQDVPFLFLHRPKDNTIVIVDLEKKKQISKFLISGRETDNKNAGGLNSFYYLNKDSVYLLYQYQIAVIDTGSILKFKKIINDPDSEVWPAIVYGNFGSVFQIYYDKIINRLLIRQNCGPCGNDTSLFRISSVGEYDFVKDTFIDLDVPFPDRYKKNYYGDALYVMREVKGDSLILTFNADPYITVYDRKNHQLKKIYSKSKFHKKEIEKLNYKYVSDINKRVEHLAESPLYLKIVYDPYNNTWYRFFLNSIQKKNKDGTYNGFRDKELIIMILDADFHTLSEINLGKGYLWNYSFVTKKGLYILKDSKVGTTNNFNEQKLIFDIFNFNAN